MTEKPNSVCKRCHKLIRKTTWLHPLLGQCDCDLHGLAVEPVAEPAEPSALPESQYDPSRCTLCGASRIPLDRAKTKFGACTLIGCKDPLHDYHREQEAKLSLGSLSAEPTAEGPRGITDTYEEGDENPNNIRFTYPAPQPVACEGITACTQKEACLKVYRCLINLPQPVAGEGPQEDTKELTFDGSWLDVAICLAVKSHAGQIDKSRQPYILHPLRVMTAVAREDEAVMIAAVLHDAVEDTELTLEYVKEQFGDQVAKMVDALSRRKGQETYREFIQRVKLNPQAAKIKIADLRDNLSRIETLPPNEQTIRQRYEKALIELGAAPEGTPKLEEIADKCCWEAYGLYWLTIDEETKRQARAPFIAILRPFITPASTPPQETVNDLRDIGQRVLNCMEKHSLPDGAIDEIEAAMANLDRVIRKLLATPASTGEALTIRCHGCKSTLLYKRIGEGEIEVYHDCTEKVSTGDANGWISVEGRLPGEQGCDSEEVVCFINGHCKITDFEARKDGGWGHALGWYDAEKRMFRVHGKLDQYVTHWQPLPPAPTSVPQAPVAANTPCSEHKAFHPACAGCWKEYYKSPAFCVPQAEPPKKETP